MRGDPVRRVVLAAKAVGAERVHVAADYGPYGSSRDRGGRAGPGGRRRRAGPHRVAVRRRARPGHQGRRQPLPGLHAVLAGLDRPRLARRRSTRRSTQGRARPGSRSTTPPTSPSRPCPTASSFPRPASARRWPLARVPRRADRRLRGRPRQARRRRHLAHVGAPQVGRDPPADDARRPGRPPGRRADDVPHRALLAGVLRRRALAQPGLGARLLQARVRARWPTTSPATRFSAWQRGRTGYPVVDAGMRQLRATGWMHNRVRMIVASFLVKDLHVEWQHGARHFLRWLVDGDLASNNHGWQWVAGSGTDAAPYFRVFNPVVAGQEVRPRRCLRTPLGRGAPRRPRPARAGRPQRLSRADRRPRGGTSRGARPMGEDPGVTAFARPAPVLRTAGLRQRRLVLRRPGRAGRPAAPTTTRRRGRPSR